MTPATEADLRAYLDAHCHVDSEGRPAPPDDDGLWVMEMESKGSGALGVHVVSVGLGVWWLLGFSWDKGDWRPGFRCAPLRLASEGTDALKARVAELEAESARLREELSAHPLSAKLAAKLREAAQEPGLLTPVFGKEEQSND